MLPPGAPHKAHAARIGKSQTTPVPSQLCCPTKAHTIAVTTPAASYPAPAPNVIALDQVKDLPMKVVQTAPSIFKAPDNSLHAVVPALLAYSDLVAAAHNELVGKTLTFTAAGKTVAVDVLDITVYPSDGGLAVGLRVSLRPPGNFLSTNGWVYAVVTPKIFNDRNTVLLTTVLSCQLDSSFSKSVRVFLDPRVVPKHQDVRPSKPSTVRTSRRRVLQRARTIVDHRNELVRRPR